LVGALCVAALLALSVALSACSYGKSTLASGTSSPSAVGGASTATLDPAATSPVESRVEGEDHTMARYSNSLVGLTFLYNAAGMTLADDPVTLQSNGFTEGSLAALRMNYLGNMGAVMWIIAIRTPEDASRSKRHLAGFAATLAAMVDDSARLRLKKGAEVRSLGTRKIGGATAYAIERRGREAGGTYEGARVRIRVLGVATKRISLIIIQEVSPPRFAEHFNGFDKMLKTLRFIDTQGA
jgi:hypothetical protein